MVPISSAAVPLISAFPQFGSTASKIPDDLVSASPSLQALLSQTGGVGGTQNVNALGASSPMLGQLLSLMNPGGGLNPAQASQFGPLFTLLMGLQGGGQQTPTPGMGL